VFQQPALNVASVSPISNVCTATMLLLFIFGIYLGEVAHSDMVYVSVYVEGYQLKVLGREKHIQT
jgi:hypothetical protein